MTVSELMALLEECDPEAEVRIMDQEGWPFELRYPGGGDAGHARE